MGINIHNIRLGPATNSSSSHSVVIIQRGNTAVDVDADTTQFGWDNFVLASTEPKLQYLATCVKNALSRTGISDRYSAIIASSLLGLRRPIDKDSYVDHESVIPVPLVRSPYDGVAIDQEFIDDIIRLLTRNDVVIAGGNDNDDEGAGPPVKYDLGNVDFDIPATGVNGDFRARRDGSVWTLFDRTSGAKWRFSYSDSNGVDIIPSEYCSNVPELVDIKVTGTCPFGCTYCYQSSTPSGKDADHYYLLTLLEELDRIGTFEVAIGGGDPSMYKHIFDIQNRAPNINFAVTTRNLAWLGREAHRIHDNFKSVAVSVDTLEKTEAALKTLIDYRYLKDGARAGWGADGSIHLVVGTMSREDTKEAIKMVTDETYRVVLLGYKNFGFGLDYAPHHDVLENLVSDISDLGLWNIGMDTELARQLTSIGVMGRHVPRVTYDIEDGNTSMYVDAVEQRAARNSYSAMTIPLESRNYSIDVRQAFHNLRG